MFNTSTRKLNHLYFKTPWPSLPLNAPLLNSIHLGQDLQRVSGTDAETFPLLFLILVAELFPKVST